MKFIVAFVVCLVAWFCYFQGVDILMMKIQGLDYFAGLR